MFAISFWDSSAVLLLWICSVFPVVSNYTLLPSCSSNFLSLTLKSLKYLWKVSTFWFFCLLSLTYWFFSENCQPTFCSTWCSFKYCTFRPSGKLADYFSYRFSKNPCPFPAVLMAVVCTLSCCAMTAELKSSSLRKANGKPCLKTRLYPQTAVMILALLCFNSSRRLVAFNTHNSCPLDFSTQIPS